MEGDGKRRRVGRIVVLLSLAFGRVGRARQDGISLESSAFTFTFDYEQSGVQRERCQR
jgi:hypothetical protein